MWSGADPEFSVESVRERTCFLSMSHRELINFKKDMEEARMKVVFIFVFSQWLFSIVGKWSYIAKLRKHM